MLLNRFSNIAVGLWVALMSGTGAEAQTADLMDVLGGHGCTLGTESRSAALAAGLTETEIDAAAAAATAAGTATVEGNYLVFDEAVCSIRLPEIESAFDVQSPEVVAMITEIDLSAAPEDQGCFIVGGVTVFAAQIGVSPDAAFVEYVRLLGAGMASGALRFYSPSPFRTPPALQVVVGDCTNVANIAEIRRSHTYFEEGFGAYVRWLGRRTTCDDRPDTGAAMEFTAGLQGVEAAQPGPQDGEINAWLSFEFDTIAMAAGWKGPMPARPPLCHY